MLLHPTHIDFTKSFLINLSGISPQFSQSSETLDTISELFLPLLLLTDCSSLDINKPLDFGSNESLFIKKYEPKFNSKF